MLGSKFLRWVIGGMAVLGLQLAYAKVIVPMYLVDENGQGHSIGIVTMTEAPYGVLLTPDLHDLPAGVHGFHIHDHPACGKNGMEAGGHLDKVHANAHNGPYVKHSHTGDLPVLVVNNDGRATLPVLAPRIHLASVEGHSLMIHAGGDNYSDHPEKLGGGGARIACGVIHIKG